MRRDTPYLSVFSPNTGKYKLEISPDLDTYHAVSSDQENCSNITLFQLLMIKFYRHCLIYKYNFTFFHLNDLLVNKR